MPIDDFQVEDGPFGNADAARVSLDDFVSIAGVFSDPRKTQDAMQDRVVVGRKGSGKTMYLRVLKDAAQKRDMLTLAELDSISTNIVVFYLRRIREYVYSMDRGDLDAFVDRRRSIISVWKILWDRAIDLSVFTIAFSEFRKAPEKLLSISAITDFCKDLGEFEDFVSTRYGDFVEFPVMSMSPQAALMSFSHFFETQRGLHKFLNDSRWNQFQKITRNLVGHLAPIAIYVDAIDEEFEEAPEAWLLCQQGLYRSIMHQGRSAEGASGRIHVVTALRDIVYAAALRTEHATRDYQSRYIKELDWGPNHIEDFLYKKLEGIISRRVVGRTLDEAIRQWIGFDTLTNGRNQKESVARYITRHSRMLPRDIILFGNSIFSEIGKQRNANRTFDDSALARAVAQVSRILCQESVAMCINELLTSSEYIEDYVSLARRRDPSLIDYRNFIDEKITRFFRLLDKEIFEYDDLRDALINSELATTNDFDAGRLNFYRLDNVLWRHGLLAYQEGAARDSAWHFNWKGASSGDVVSAKVRRYGFHSCVIDLFGVKPSPDGPVY